jgi:hypothetical protein
MGILIETDDIRQQVTVILQRLDLAETEAELRDLAEQSWHQLFGMYRLLDNTTAPQREDDGQDLLAQALKAVEAVFDERPKHYAPHSASL